MGNLVRHRRRETLNARRVGERGQTLTEYALIVVLVVVACLVVLKLYGAQIKGLFIKASKEIAEKTDTPNPVP